MPNKPLKRLIDEHVQKRKKKWKEQYQAFLAEGAPQVFFCGLTKQIMMEPILASDGETYEKSAFLEFVAACERGKVALGVRKTRKDVVMSDLISSFLFRPSTYLPTDGKDLVSPISNEKIDATVFPNLSIKRMVLGHVEKKKQEWIEKRRQQQQQK